MKKNTNYKLNGKKPKEVKNMYESFLANPSQSGVTYISNYKKAYLKDEIKMALKKACGSDNLYAIIDVNLLNKALNELAVAKEKYKNDKTTRKRYSDCNSYLKKYIQFVENSEVGNPEPEPEPEPEDPISKLKELASSVNETVPDSLLNAIKQMKPQSFEVLIKKLLVSMGYGKTPEDVIVTQYVGDNGIDGYVRKDRMGIEKLCAYQAKRYTDNKVGIVEMNALGGSMINCGTKCGILVTTTDFTQKANEYNPSGFTILRIDGKSLVGYLIEYGIGVKTEQIEVKTVDTDFLNSL